jgi:hypothetical protein
MHRVIGAFENGVNKIRSDTSKEHGPFRTAISVLLPRKVENQQREQSKQNKHPRHLTLHSQITQLAPQITTGENQSVCRHMAVTIFSSEFR